MVLFVMPAVTVNVFDVAMLDGDFTRSSWMLFLTPAHG